MHGGRFLGNYRRCYTLHANHVNPGWNKMKNLDLVGRIGKHITDGIRTIGSYLLRHWHDRHVEQGGYVATSYVDWNFITPFRIN